MSKIIKQSYVALSPEKKLIQNDALLRQVKARMPEEENAVIRAAREAAEHLPIEAVFSSEDAFAEENEWERRREYEAEAERILEEANAGKAKIYEEAYKTGMEKAREELSRRQEILEQEYFAKKEAIEKELRQQYKAEYEKELQLIEGKMILWMKGMLEKLVGQAGRREETLIHLIRMGLQEISLQGDLIIRVSEEDLKYVLEHKAELTEELSEKLVIEVLKDKNLKKNQCIIETIMGNIECSLDVQLKGISDELQLIHESIMKNINNI